MKLNSKLIASITLSLAITSSANADCRTYIADHIEWAKSADDFTDRNVYYEFTASTILQDSTVSDIKSHSSHKSGELKFQPGYFEYVPFGTFGTYRYIPERLEDVNSFASTHRYFSDRDGTYFDRTKGDKEKLTFNYDGTGSNLLITWGNTKVPLTEMVCTKQGNVTFINAIHGTSAASFALHNTESGIFK